MVNGQYTQLAIALRDGSKNPVNVVSFDARVVVGALAEEPNPGRKANELTYALTRDIEIALTSRDRYHGVALVRVNGEVVYRESDAQGKATLTPGDWQDVLHAKAETIRELNRQREIQDGGVLTLRKAA